MAARKKKKAVRKKKPIVRKKAIRIKKKVPLAGGWPKLQDMIDGRNKKGQNLRDTNIAFIKHVLTQANIKFTESPTGREIVFGDKNIKINHNGQMHWTIRVPGAAKDGIRLQLGTDIVMENGLFVIADTLAIKYDN